MSKFKVGDRVRRINSEFNDLKVDSISEVESISLCGHLSLKGFQGVFDKKNFEFANEYPNPPHKHAELIKAYADGAEIEYYNLTRWVDTDEKHAPKFNKDIEYRIKPQKSDKDIEIERIESEMRKLADDLVKVKSS